MKKILNRIDKLLNSNKVFNKNFKNLKIIVTNNSLEKNK